MVGTIINFLVYAAMVLDTPTPKDYVRCVHCHKVLAERVNTVYHYDRDGFVTDDVYYHIYKCDGCGATFVKNHP